MIDLNCIQLEDGLVYAVIDEIVSDTNKYIYLVNVNDEEDFCIRKYNINIGEDKLLGLDSNEEFDKALLLFTKRHNNV